VQSFSGALYAHSVDVSQLKHHAHLLSPSTVVATVAETVGGDVQQLVDRWNQLVGETSDREVIRTASLSASCTIVDDTIRYDTRCYFNVRSKADISQLNLPHGTDN